MDHEEYTCNVFDSPGGSRKVNCPLFTEKRREKQIVKLYEVNQQIEDLLARLEPDPETGEIPPNEDELIAQINALALKREDILTYLAKVAINTKATVQGLKAEEKRLKDRRQRMEQKQERLITILDRECGGEKTDLGIATLYYR